jgi:hypothetical protein
MQLNSLTTGFCACVGLLLALHSIPVAEDNLAEEHILVEQEGNLAVDTPVEDILVAEAETLVVDTLVAEADTPVEDTLEEASAALQSLILAVHADQDLSHALLLVAVQVVVLLLVVRMVVPGCSYGSPSLVPGYQRQ